MLLRGCLCGTGSQYYRYYLLTKIGFLVFFYCGRASRLVLGFAEIDLQLACWESKLQANNVTIDFRVHVAGEAMQFWKRLAGPKRASDQTKREFKDRKFFCFGMVKAWETLP